MTRGNSLIEHVTDLRRHLGERREVSRTVALPDLALTTAAVPEGAEIGVELVLEAIFEGVVVSGSLTVPWEGQCRRCLNDITGELEVEIREVFEVKPVDGETWPLIHDEVDLEPIIRDAVLLTLPLAPLCGDDCLGPAPDTYPARPEASAETVAEPEDLPGPDPRWAALDQLDLS